MRLFSNAAAKLVAEYRRAPGAEPLEFARTDSYRQFVDAAEETGFTGSDVEMDVDFASRSAGWVASAGEEELRCWLHTAIRADRWNGEYPTAILDACRAGCIVALVERLSGSAGALHAGR